MKKHDLSLHAGWPNICIMVSLGMPPPYLRRLLLDTLLQACTLMCFAPIHLMEVVLWARLVPICSKTHLFRFGNPMFRICSRDITSSEMH